ncbi:MAG: response regulator [Devosia sp.]
MPLKITVLVVEDDPLLRMYISDELEHMGFTVLEAAHAAEAVEMLQTNSDIQIMFTDVDMPGGMDGLMLAAAVRDRWPPIKIIVTSGHRNVRMGDIPAESRFISKPYQARSVAAAINEMMAA